VDWSIPWLFGLIHHHNQQFAVLFSKWNPETPQKEKDPRLWDSFWWAEQDSNLRSLMAPDLQSGVIDRSTICPYGISWSRLRDLNPRPAVYKTAALPLS
jgi:hypothetical protein